MQERIYLRSSSSDRDYHWYEYLGDETRACDDPAAWDVVRGLMAHEEPCLAVVKDQQGRWACILTGQLSPRRARSRYVYDAWIVSAPDGELTALQRGLLSHFLSQDSGGRIRELSTSVEDQGVEGVRLRGQDMEPLLDELAAAATSLDAAGGEGLPPGAFRDTGAARACLANALGAGGDAGPGEILAIVTSGVRPEMLTRRALWALTDHDRAEPLQLAEEKPERKRADESVEEAHGQTVLSWEPAPEPRPFQFPAGWQLVLRLGTGAAVLGLLILLWWLRRD